MHILFIVPRLPSPPTKGDRLRSLYLIRELSRNNTIHLISFIESLEEKEHISILERYCEKVNVVYLPRWKSILNILTNISFKQPFQTRYYKSNKMRKIIGNVMDESKYDLAHISLMRMAPYIKYLKGLPVFLDHIDCLSLNMKRRYETEKGFLRKRLFRNEYIRMKNYEFMYRYLPSVVTSEKDKKALESYEIIKVIANGVDTDGFKFLSESNIKKTIDLIFVGNMGYYPNIQAMEFFIKKIYPRVKKFQKDIKVYIVGTNPKRVIKSMANNENVFVTGFVDDVKKYLYRSKIFIAPVQSGSGIQNKILEAMSCGVPVVTTSMGNSGIKAKDNKEIIIANDPISFAENIILLLDNKQRRMLLCHQARKFVEDRFSWKKRGTELESFYHEVINKCQFQPDY